MRPSRSLRLVPPSIRGMLVGLLLYVLVPLLIVQALIYLFWYTARVHAELEANREVARVVAAMFESYVRDVTQQEFALGQAILLLDPKAPSFTNEANRILKESAKGYPSITRFNWVDLRGIVTASGAPAARNLDLSDRQYISDILHKVRTTTVSPLLESKATHTDIFTISRGIFDQKGTLRGIVSAVVEPKRLGELDLSVHRNPGGSYAIVDRHGMLVYHDPPLAPGVSRDWSRQYSVIQKTLRTQQEHTDICALPGEKKRRFVGQVPIRSIGWSVGASRYVEVAMAPVWRGIFIGIGLLLLVAVALLVTALRMARHVTEPVIQLHASTRAFGGGDFYQRVVAQGPTEIRELGQAFNEMAGCIQEQQEELASQNEELHSQQEELAVQNEELLAQQEELTAQNTELARLTHQLETEHAFLNSALELLPAPVFFLSPDRRVIRLNRASAAMLGEANPQQWLEQTQLLHADTRIPIPRDRWPLARVVDGETTATLEALAILPTGRELPVLLSAAAVHVTGQLIATVVIAQDITDLKAEDRAKDEFLAVLSHELLTPVTSMLGWAQVAQDDVQNSALMTQALTVIERNARRQKRLVDELLDVSRIIHGKLALSPEPVDAWNIVEQQVENAAQLAESAGIRIVLEPPASPLRLHADPLRTGQAIDNLLSNALKFTPRGGTVTIHGAIDGAWAVLTFRDTGRGIPLEQLGELFLPFRQVQRDESTGGLGLGLALVRGIIELQGGHVCADSAGVGQGSTFTIHLPLVTSDVADVV